MPSGLPKIPPHRSAPKSLTKLNLCLGLNISVKNLWQYLSVKTAGAGRLLLRKRPFKKMYVTNLIYAIGSGWVFPLMLLSSGVAEP